MKKLIFILAALLCTVFICACGNKENEEPANQNPTTENPPADEPEYTVPADVLAEIKTAFYNKYKEFFVSEYYTYTAEDVTAEVYSEYNGAYVMFITAPMMGYGTAIVYQTVDGVQFVYPSGQTFDVYSDGHFYKLAQAFENKLLTHSDLLDLREKHSKKELLYFYEEN